MVDDFYFKRHPRQVVQLNIVPILDMLTTVIFFLLLSTTFIEFTKLTVPPSKVTTVSDPVKKPPLQPKIMLTQAGDVTRILLSWGGERPGESALAVQAQEANDVGSRRAAILEKSRKLVEEFHQRNPEEKAIQLGLGSKVGYQDLISLMDGVREVLPDIVLISPQDAEAGLRNAGEAPAPGGGAK